MNITLEQAEAVIKAAKERSRELNILENIAIVDAGVNLVAFARMDDAWIGSIDVAIRKARTARYFNMETGVLGQWSQPGGQGWQIEHSNGGLITIPGGVPLKNENGEIIGAIGASGSSAENDGEVAKAGAAVVK